MAHEPRHEELAQAEDRLPRARLLGTTLATVIATVVVCLVAWWIASAREAQLRPDHAWPEKALRPGQEPYQVPRAIPVEHEAARIRLDSWGWVDRPTRTVRIPIDRAIDLYVRAHGGQK